MAVISQTLYFTLTTIDEFHMSEYFFNCAYICHDWTLWMPVKMYCNQWESDDQW